MKLYRRGKYYYASPWRVSLRTTNKGIAEFKLRRLILEKHGMTEKKIPTVGGYYEKWIETKREPMVRKSLARSYMQHFQCYVLPELSVILLGQMTVSCVLGFRTKLLASHISLKTARNIFSSLQAMWRDASAEYELKNPFANLQWPREPKTRPAIFTLMEVAAILAAFKKHEPFYFPWVLTQFATGMGRVSRQR
jgi:hypothetical protein